MDFRLTAGFYTTLWWSSDKLWALWLQCSYWFLLLYAVVLRRFPGKVVPKGHTPFKIYRIQTSHPPENKPFHTRGWKVSDFPPEYLFYRNAGIVCCCFHAYLLSLCICTHVYDTIDSPCSNPVTQLIAWQLYTVCCLHWLITLAQTLFIYFRTGHKELHQTEMSRAFLWHLQP